MKSSLNHAVRAVATGVIVLVFFGIVLFWLRYGVEVRLADGLPEEARTILISPSKLLPSDAEAPRPSVARAVLQENEEAGLGRLGIMDYAVSRYPGGRLSDVFYNDESSGRWIYFDRPSGKLVWRAPDPQNRRGTTFYAGPNGISRSPEAEVGRFVDLMDAEVYWTGVVFDRALRRFYRIDIQMQQVVPGPDLKTSPDVQPVRIGRNLSDTFYVWAYWEAPSRVVQREPDENGATRRQIEYTMPSTMTMPLGLIPVVNASGRIDLLDTETLLLDRGKGYLPDPRNPRDHTFARPNLLLGYDVVAVGAGEGLPYVGLVACSASREGTSASLAVYDEAGNQVADAATRVVLSDTGAGRATERSDDAVLWSVPWGPALAISKYVLETVHPPLLTLVTFWLVDRIDVRAGHQSLLLLPDSFAAMYRIKGARSLSWRFAGALWTMVPAILIASFLAWRIGRDATSLGLSSGLRHGWIIATLAFSVPAYIAYRLTRPKETLVTCANCGRPRRPDAARCHCCRSPWQVPELVAPGWRILDGGPDVQEKGDESEKLPPRPEPNGDSPVELM